jgi:ABC-type branched-subunit amino acid transport system substrate-binding protein
VSHRSANYALRRSESRTPCWRAAHRRARRDSWCDSHGSTGSGPVARGDATEIKIGNINPYSGPASGYGSIGKTIGAWFTKVNDEGGINGRKISYITYDDGYSPPKAVEMARKLVEQDQVLLIFSRSVPRPTPRSRST